MIDCRELSPTQDELRTQKKYLLLDLQFLRIDDRPFDIIQGEFELMRIEYALKC